MSYRDGLLGKAQYGIRTKATGSLRYGDPKLLDPYAEFPLYQSFEDMPRARTAFPTFFQPSGRRPQDLGALRLGAAAVQPTPDQQQGTAQPPAAMAPLGAGEPSWLVTVSKALLYAGAVAALFEDRIGWFTRGTIATMAVAVAQLY